MATITKQGRGFKITVSQGTDCNGKKIREYMTWIPEPGMTDRQIEKEVHRQAVLFEEKVRSGTTVNSNIRFKEFADKYKYMEEYAKLYLKPKTVATYTDNLKRINLAIGHIRLRDLRPGPYKQLLPEFAGGRNQKPQFCRKQN